MDTLQEQPESTEIAPTLIQIVHVGDDSTELTREGITRTLKPSNNKKDYVDVHVVLDMGVGTSAISEGTVARN